MSNEIQNVPAQKQANNVTTQVNFFDPQQFATAQRMSQLFASSMLVPDTYQTAKIYQDLVGKQHMKPEEAAKQAGMTAVANCMIALDISARIGASPLMVMQNLVIIYGRPSWSSKFLISTVNTCGRFEPLKFRFTEKGKLGKFNYTEYQKQWVDNPTGKGYYKNTPITREFDGTKTMDIECVAYTTAKGSKDVLESSPISLRMAIDEGWYLKNGSKWQTMPRQMLMYRAASFWTSVYAPELSMGMRTVEEAQDAEYIEIKEDEDAAVQVEQEKQEQANKETIGFGDDQGKEPERTDNTSDETPKGVDPETGEIKEAQQIETAQQSAENPDGPSY